ncbi:MAG: DUF4365 domain-containing protein, partial [Flavobacteriaceae bacterium]|nr:DUF4365 domain-containing protein [Flavobacteriaceae bacterium]
SAPYLPYTYVGGNYKIEKMTTKWKKSKQTENSGLLYVASVANDCNCILNKIDGSNDIGLDGYLEFVEKESVTGLCIGLQVKSGDSYQNQGQSFAIIKGDKDHFIYWSEHTLPIVGITFIPEDKKAYWIDITKYLKDNPSVIKDGPYTIPVNKDSVFDANTFSLFYQSFLSYKNSFNEDWNFGRTLRSIVDFRSINMRIDALKSLFYFHRNQKESWYYIIQQFRIEDDERIQGLLIHTLRHVISHGDIFWHEDNIVDNETTKYARTLISKYFGADEIEKLLDHIDDETGISRGSFGQNIYPLIDLIPNKVEFLKKVIIKTETSDHVTSWAAIILIDVLQRYDLERAINFADSMVNNFPNSDHHEHFVLVRDALRENSYVDFTG